MARAVFPRAVALGAGAVFVALGLWAMVDPQGFFDSVAEFEPYNQHFLQDIGAFQIGLGTVLLLVGWPAHRDPLALGLLGVGVGSGAHALAHVLGSDLGGRPGLDIPLFTASTVLLLAAAFVRWRED